MQKLFLVDINLNGNQIKSASLEQLASAPSVAIGKVYYDTTKHAIGICNGTSWSYIGGDSAEHGSINAVNVENGVITVVYADGTQDTFKVNYIIPGVIEGLSDASEAGDIQAAFGTVAELKAAVADKLPIVLQVSDNSVAVVSQASDSGSAITLEVVLGDILTTYTLSYADNAYTSFAESLKSVLGTSDVVDNLTTASATQPLSANQGKVLKESIDSNKTTIDAYTVNGKAISTNPELSGADVDLSEGYAAAESYTAPAAGDSIDVAVGKLAKGIEDAAAGGVQSVNGQTGAITIAEGDANGQIKVGTENVPVHGLGTAAYQNSSAFDAAGSADAVKADVIGSEEDTSDLDTIHAAKKYAEEQADAAKVTVVNDLTTGGSTSALSAEQGKTLKTLVDGKVASVAAGDASVKVAGTATAPTVAVKLSADPGILSLGADGLKATAPAEVPYTGVNAIKVSDHQISLVVDPSDDVLTQGASGLKVNLGIQYDSGQKRINLLGNDSTVLAYVDATAFIKDGMVQNVSFEPSTKILTITFNTDAGTEPIEVDLTSLVDTYTAGNGINISGNAISVVVDPATESFLTVGASGLKLAGVQEAINTAKGEAISTAASDATQKANTAEQNAKKYADGIVEAIPAGVQQYTQTIATSESSPVTIAKATHGCGNTPIVQTIMNAEQVVMNVGVSAAGEITIGWNGTLPADVTVVVLGK